jgi:L-cysteine/cystine lyase
VTELRIDPPVLGDAALAAVRAELPVLDEWLYLNAGTAGPLPRRVAAAMREAIDEQLGGPRSDLGYLRDRLAGAREDARVAFASLLGCDASELVLTSGVSPGMNVATLGVGWSHGDEAITTDVEHPGALFPLYCVRDAFGVTLRFAEVAGKDAGAALDAIVASITPRTKLISLSHVSFATGQVLPVAELCAIARERGVRVVVDGAQAFGCLPIDVRALGCDYYAVPGQKWVCGPEGSGALYCAADAISETALLYPGFHSAESWDEAGGFALQPDASRFESGTSNLSTLVGAASAIDWLRDDVGIDAAHSRSRALAERAIARLDAVDGFSVATPRGEHAGLVCALPAAVAAEELVARLRAAGVQIRSLQAQGAIRLSFGFFNTEAEVDRVCGLLAESRHH